MRASVLERLASVGRNVLVCCFPVAQSFVAVLLSVVDKALLGQAIRLPRLGRRIACPTSATKVARSHRLFNPDSAGGQAGL